ncbi:MAG: selenide, water dikinase SelD [Pseudomonadota bacterium]
MRHEYPLTRDLVLVGGGHTHALVLRAWGMDPQPGVRVTVINPGPTAPYSGMLPGHIAGHYDRDDLDIDLVRLARFAGARLIDGAVTRVDARAQRLHIAGRGVLAYDVASLDVGINAEMPSLPGFADHGIPAKPLGPFASQWRAFLDAAKHGHRPPQVAVIGAGVAGIELSMACAHALRQAGQTPTVTLLEQSDNVMVDSMKARRRLLDGMRAQGVVLRTGATVTAVQTDHVTLQDGATIPSHFTIGATGARPHGWLARGDLPLIDGFIPVDSRLRVDGHDTLFATGDCAHLTHAPRPKAGVFAVRAAPVLHGNLRAALSGGSLKPFEPQTDYLKLISLGEKSALGEKWGVLVSGPWVWRLKDKIDRDFMDRVNKAPTMTEDPLPLDRARGMDEGISAAKPLCAGCGSKVSQGALTQVLATSPNTAFGDDAAVQTVGSLTQVQSVDHLRAFSADVETFARIATLHALGDIWAMGAVPKTALATVILPHANTRMQTRLLEEVLSAVSQTLGDAGATLVGGHSLMGAEMSLGLSVTGEAKSTPIGLSGARPGDALVLTRGIGSGTIFAAEMARRARGQDVLDLLVTLTKPQGDAAARLSHAHAMTDVTGFGLAGHLMNICRASGVGAKVVLDAVPLFAGATDLAHAGERSSLYGVNAQAAPVEGATGAVGALLHDPQTAGGFLAAIPASKAQAAVADIRALGHDAAQIGEVLEGAPVIRCV